jgi:RND family efflux transporter MFP subunit
VSVIKSVMSIVFVSGVSYAGAKYGAPVAMEHAHSQWKETKIEAPPAPPDPPAAAEAEQAEAWTGVLVAQAVELSTRFDGKVAKVLVRAGDTVRKDDVVAELDTSTYKHELAAAEASLRASRAEAWNAGVSLAAARDRQSRRAGSVKFGDTQIAIVSDEEVSGAKFDSLSAASRAGAASATAEERRARLEQLRQMMSEAKMRAPFDGIVAARYFDSGAHLRTGVPLLRLVGKGSIRVRFAVPEAEAKSLKLAAHVAIDWDPSPSSGTASGGSSSIDKKKQLDAVIDRIAPEVESASSSVFVEAEVEASAEMALAGRVVRVRMQPATRPNG